MTPGVRTDGIHWGDDVIDGNIVFNENVLLHAVQDRINSVLDSLYWPSALRRIFTGNVGLQQSSYAPRSTALQVMQDAADAEFPDMSNLYIGGPRWPGYVVFHGRKARFNPSDSDYDIHWWYLADDVNAASDPATFVRISPPLEVFLDDTSLYTSALATYYGIADIDLAAQYVQDDAAVALEGLRTWTAEGLYTRNGEGPTTGGQETQRFAYFIRDNFKYANVRVGQVTIKHRDPSSIWGAATWQLFGLVELSDLVLLTTTHAGGGGFAGTKFYVEGIHYTARPGPSYPIVELTLDLSPADFYDTNPWGD